MEELPGQQMPESGESPNPPKDNETLEDDTFLEADVNPQQEETDAELAAEMAQFDKMMDTFMADVSEHKLNSIVNVPVVEITEIQIMVDMGDKAEGVFLIDEVRDHQGQVALQIGDRIDVMVLGRETETGLITTSYRQALAQRTWDSFTSVQESGQTLTGVVTRAVKAGVLVDVGVEVFMPGSQISDRRVHNLEDWVGKEVEVVFLDLDLRKRRAVVSRRKLVEKAKEKAREELLKKVNEGDLVTGQIRSVLDFGAFLDIGGIDAFLPRDEISWDRAALPSKVLKKGESLEVKILQIDHKTGRIKVSRKSLIEDPWATVEARFPADSTVRGEVVSVTRYGAFVHLAEGLTGLIHVSDLSWSKGHQKVEEHIKEGDQVETLVLSVDLAKKRIALGLKQLAEDPWLDAEKQFPRNSKIKGKITGLTNFGAFVQITDEIEGLIHISDIAWDKKIKHANEEFKVGDEVEALVLKTDATTRRFSLGLKQLTQNPMDLFYQQHPVGSSIEGEVVRMIDTGAFISLAPKIDGFLHVSQINTERVEKPSDALTVGEKITCKISKIEKKSGKISLSRKALLEKEERAAIRQFTSDNKNQSGGMKLGELFQGLDLKISDK